MDENEKLIHDWQEKVRATFGSDSQLYHYLFETMDNFYYRYLETASSRDLKTQDLGNKTWGAVSFEDSMVDALKTKNPKTRPGIMELAKAVPKAQHPKIRLGLKAVVHELTADRGHLTLISEVSWDFPEFTDAHKSAVSKVEFKYDGLDQFRKQLALKLESACELFI